MVAVARWGKSCQSSSINCPSSDLSDVWWTSTRQKKFIRHCSLYFTYKETISPRAVPLTVVCWQSLTWAKVGQTLLTQMFLEWVGFCGMEHSTQHWQLFENKMKIKTITPENMNSRKKICLEFLCDANQGYGVKNCSGPRLFFFLLKRPAQKWWSSV